MPKLPNVTNEEIAAIVERVHDLCADMHDIANRMEKSDAVTLEKPMETARALLGMIRATAELQMHVMAKATMDEQQRAIEAMLRARQEKQVAAG